MQEDNAAIRTLRAHAAKSIEEWAMEVRDPNGCGIDLAFVEGRTKHILEIIKAIDALKKL